MKFDVKYLQIIVWVISLVVLAIGGVLYLEHRHQAVIEVLAENKTNLRHVETKLEEVCEDDKKSNERIYKALDALQKNDKELAIQVIESMYCCEIGAAKGKAKKKVKKAKVASVIPYTLTFKDNPGVDVIRSKE